MTAKPTVELPVVTEDKKPGWKEKPKGGLFALALICAGIAAALAPSEGGRRLDVYRDSAGILTACTGIIGPVVNARGFGGKFTEDECKALESAYLAKMVTAMQACVPSPVLHEMTYGEWIAFGHFSYQAGNGAFCRSTLARKLASGDHAGACRAMASWTYITVKGVKVNCRDPNNRCRGIPKRRDMEVSMCLDALP
jgi:lysozyme